MENAAKNSDLISQELPEVLDELSFSYMLVYSAQQSITDLNNAIKELSDLLDFYKADSKS